MIVEETGLPGVLLIKPVVHTDNRGFFMEAYQSERYAQAGIKDTFIQDNHSGSKQGTLRGLHYQIQQAQTKLVRAIVGEVFDVAVDLRRSSPTFGKWFGTIISAENKHQLYIPKEFAHGYYTLSERAEVLYKVTDFYSSQWERSLLWNDSSLNIEWPLVEGKEPLLSEKDRAAKTLEDADLFD